MTETAEGRGTPPPQVALCADTDALNRFGGLLRHLAVGLVDQAVRLELLSDDARAESHSLGPVRALVHRRPSWPAAKRRYREIIDSLSAQPPTIVHAFSSGSYALAAQLAGAYDADLVVTVTSLADCEALVGIGGYGVGHVFAMSAPLESVVVEQLKMPSGRVSVVRPGVLALDRAACFDRAGCIPTILSTSPLERSGGIEHLIEAVAKLRQRDQELMLFLLGQGRAEDAIRRKIRQLGLSSAVTLAHPRGDVTGALRNADIFVLPRQAPFLSADTLQAMGAGVAVVAYASAVCDHLRPGETAVICDRPSSDSLADAIEGLLRDRAAARALAERGMEHVRTHHAVSEAAQRTADVYRELTLSHSTIPLKE